MLLRCSFFLTLLLFLISAASSFSSHASSHVEVLFENWCREHGKTYASEQERGYRLGVFEDNYNFIKEHSQMGNSSYTLSLNAFADLTHHEFKSSRLGLSLSRADPARTNLGETVFVGELPSSVDWREKGAVTNVKDQGSCGACWAFASTGAIEGINKIVTGSLVSLSEQELIDCDRSYNSGCGGGLMDYAYEFVIKNSGIDTEKDYPFEGRERTCKRKKLKRHVVTIDDYSDVPDKNERALMKAVATQPVSVGICGSGRAFQLYSTGIFTGPCCTALDHAVLIVGYGSANGMDYWIVKNSWGPSWGKSGYIYIQRNTGNPEGLCGINTLASYPTKTHPNPPPSPPPGPTKCSLFTYCQPGETCCCSWRFLGICLSWKCCGLGSAVCCKDGVHCCPRDYPICDIDRDLCLRRTAGNVTNLETSMKRASPTTFSGIRTAIQDWIL